MDHGEPESNNNFEIRVKRKILRMRQIRILKIKFVDPCMFVYLLNRAWGVQI
jgi:hypothetical protein